MIKDNQFIKIRPYYLGVEIELCLNQHNETVSISKVNLPSFWYWNNELKVIDRNAFSSLFNTLIELMVIDAR